MKLEEAVRTRRSVRGYHEDRPVDREVIVRTLELAQWAPSNCNVQPWRVWVLSGPARDRLRDALCGEMDKGNLGDPTDPIDDFPGDYRRLQVECGAELYGCMGVERGDMMGRFQAHRRNFEFFDAPHVAIVGMAEHFGIGVAMDVGIWLQTWMLALTAEGVQCCPQAALRQYPELVREKVGIPGDIRVLCGLSFGYEDEGVDANAVRQRREALEQNVVFLDE